MKIHPHFNWINLTPEQGHFLFGYYDRCPWDAEARRHLALRVGQQQHLPQPHETADVGFVDRREPRFKKLAVTRAWNHQQGAMTLWLAHIPGALVFNDFVQEGDAWRAIARVLDIDGNDVGRYDTHIYAVSEDGQWSAILDFGRIPRRGYSYALAPLSREKLWPNMDDDGLFLVNMKTGEKKLIVPYRRFFELHPFPYDLEGHYVWLNHTIFNCDATRLMVLFRHEATSAGRWRTHLFTAGLDGGDLRCPVPDVYWGCGGGISHQIWGRRPDEILVDAGWCGRGNEYVLLRDAASPRPACRVSNGLGPMSHLVYSPEGRWIAADTYPDGAGFQRLGLVDVASGCITELGRFRHRTPGATGELRCDLHPRWSADGRYLTVDTIHEGGRKIFMLEMEPVFSSISGSQAAEPLR